jgi:hypothetical protein
VVRLGQPARLLLTLVPPAGCSPGAIRIAESGGAGFVLRGITEAEGAAGAPGDGTLRLEVEVVPFALGEIEFPGLVVPWVCPAGGPPETRTEPLPLTVEPTLPEPETAEPADIRGSARLEGREAQPWLLGAALLLALAGTVAWWRGRPSGPIASPAPAPPPDPFEGLTPAAWARRALDRLAADEVLRRDGAGPYHDRLAGIMRAYVQGVFGIEAREQTTSEILDSLAGHARAAGSSRSDLRRVLSGCDLVKFARASAEERAAEALRQDALSFVSATEPAPAVERSP